jgi:hypothetical protein
LLVVSSLQSCLNHDFHTVSKTDKISKNLDNTFTTFSTCGRFILSKGGDHSFPKGKGWKGTYIKEIK